MHFFLGPGRLGSFGSHQGMRRHKSKTLLGLPLHSRVWLNTDCSNIGWQLTGFGNNPWNFKYKNQGLKIEPLELYSSKYGNNLPLL